MQFNINLLINNKLYVRRYNRVINADEQLTE